MGENEPVTGSPAGPVLPDGEVRAAEALLALVFGEQVVVQAAKEIWGRSHVVRLRLDTGRSVVLKRRDRPDRRGGQGFNVELAALEYLNDMPVPVAPRCSARTPKPASCYWRTWGKGRRSPTRC
jgi:hypothetical protein